MTIENIKRYVETTIYLKSKELGLGLVIMYRGFRADGALLLLDHVEGLHEKAGTSGSAALSQQNSTLMGWGALRINFQVQYYFHRPYSIFTST